VHKPDRVNDKQPGTLSVAGNRATIALASSDGGSVVFEGTDAASGSGAATSAGAGVKPKTPDAAASPGFLLIFRGGQWHLERVAAAYSVRSNTTTRETPPVLPGERVLSRSSPRGRPDCGGHGSRRGPAPPTDLDDGDASGEEAESVHGEGEPGEVSSGPSPPYAQPASRRPPAPRPPAKARIELVEPDLSAVASPPTKRPRRERVGPTSPPSGGRSNGGGAALDMDGGGGGGLGRSAAAGKAPMRAAPASPASSGRSGGDGGDGSGGGSPSRWHPVASKSVAQKGVASKTVALKGMPGQKRSGAPTRAAKKPSGGTSSRRRTRGSDDDDDEDSSGSSDLESVSGSSSGDDSSDGSFTSASTE